MKKFPLWLRTFLCGLCLAIPLSLDGKAPAIAAFLAFFAGIPALYFLFGDILGERTLGYRQYLYRGFFFAYGFHIGVYQWFVSLYPLDFIADFSPFEAIGVVCVAWFGLSLVAAACYAFIYPTFALVARLSFPRRHKLLLPPLFAAVYTVFSFLISLTWAGVPWGNLAISQTAHPYLIGTASLFGSYLTTFIVILTNGLLALALLLFLRTQKSERRFTTVRAPIFLAVGIFLLNTLTGAVLSHVPHEKEGTLTVLLLQGNVSSRDKWRDDGESLYDRYERILRESLAEADAAGRYPDLVVWTETALLTTFSNPNEPPSATVRALSSLSAELKVDNLVGAFSEHETADGEIKRYNSLFLFRQDGTVSETVYHKRRPVPFGEFTPWKPLIRAFFPFMEDLVISDELSAGEDSAVFFEEYGSLGALICFDSIYENLARDAVADGAEALLISTNDSWFGTSVALDNHHSQAILRAVENGRDVARAGNTGISSVISRRGEVRSTLEVMREGYLVGEIAFYGDMTLYTRVGNLFLLLCALFYFGCACPDFYAWLSQKNKKSENGSLSADGDIL